MIASNVSRATLEDAASRLGVEVEVSTLNTKGTRHRVKVNPGGYLSNGPYVTASGRKGTPNRRYQRISPNGRRVAAVCWHGFRDYFRAVFEIEPKAVFRTALETWRGKEDFESRYRVTASRNIGSMMQPMMMADACVCPDAGECE